VYGRAFAKNYSGISFLAVDTRNIGHEHIHTKIA
jgi:hypothetical protein